MTKMMMTYSRVLLNKSATTHLSLRIFIFYIVIVLDCFDYVRYFNENKKRGISVFGYSKANIKFMGTAVKRIPSLPLSPSYPFLIPSLLSPFSLSSPRFIIYYYILLTHISVALEGTTKISFDKFNEVYSYLYQTKHTKIQKIKEEKEEKEEEKEGKEKRRDKRRYKDEVMIERYSPPTIMIRFIGFVLEYAGDFEMTCSNHPYVARITYKEKVRNGERGRSA